MGEWVGAGGVRSVYGVGRKSRGCGGGTYGSGGGEEGVWPCVDKLADGG